MNKITHVAIRHKGLIYSLPAPNRHHHVIRMIHEKTGSTNIGGGEGNQGFLDSEGVYLRRKEALARAMETGQLLERAFDVGGGVTLGQLYSEDIW